MSRRYGWVANPEAERRKGESGNVWRTGIVKDHSGYEWMPEGEARRTGDN